VLWSELPPWKRRAELAKVHPNLTEDALIADGRNVPKLRPQIDAQKSKEDKLMVVLRHFGDEGHPQPVDPASYGPAINGGEPVFRSPPWRRLPRLDDVDASEGQPSTGPAAKDKGGRPSVEISKATLHEIFRQSLERARSTAKRPKPTYQEIADDNGVGRTWVTPIVKWAVKHQKEARSAIALSETPSRFSTFVRD
jgi:hypothetical protein